MRSFQIAGSLQHDEPPYQIRNLCFDAKEILGAYMEGPYPLEDGDRPGMPDGEEEDTGDVMVHETTEVPINSRQYVTISNLPYVFSEGSDLRPVLDPGFVALRSAPFPSEAVPRRFGKDPLDDQLIFRLPLLGTRAAIFHGWEMTERTEIPARQTQELGRIGTLLRFVRRSLRTLMVEDMDAYEATYLSKTPRPIGSDALFDFLGSIFDQ